MPPRRKSKSTRQPARSQSPSDAPPTCITFIPPSIDLPALHASRTYTYHSPPLISTDPCVLGIDEAGRGPVLGPMVYAAAYTPLNTGTALLRSHAFDDSKKLTATFRSSLLSSICAPSHALNASVGWAVTLLSARDISAGMLRAAGAGSYNLNAQAHDTTVQLIREVISRGVDVREVYVDTVGLPGPYQKKLEGLFPGVKITVQKQADSVYPVVSAASVCAKVTRDVALEMLAMPYVPASPLGKSAGSKRAAEDEQETNDVKANEKDAEQDTETAEPENPAAAAIMGSGYPGDEKTKSWLRKTRDPVFGWDAKVARFSWRTVRDLLEDDKAAVGVLWKEEVEEGGQRIDAVFGRQGRGLEGWFGAGVGVGEF